LENREVNGTTNLSNTVITGSLTHTGNLTVIGNTTQTGNITVNGDLTVSALVLESISIFQNNITTTNSNDDLQLEASGTGRIYVPENDVLIERNLTVNGVLTANHIETEDTLIAPTISNGDIEVAGNLIRTTASNSDLELSANGSGIIRLVDSDVLVEQDLTVTGTATVNSNVTVTGVINQTGDFAQTGNFTQTGDFTLDGTLTVTEQAQFEDIRIDQNVITTTLGNNDLILQAAGTGNVIVPQNDVVIEQNLTFDGDVIAGSIVVDQSFSAPVLGTDDIIIENNGSFDEFKDKVIRLGKTLTRTH
jgi:cytoskeletal protein CcmA (bactofilin family)